MEIVNGFPPNYQAILAVFPQVHGQGVVFAYGDKIYNPRNDPLRPDIIAHEEVHKGQQAAFPGGVEAWWKNYLADKKFMLAQEVEAYRVQYRFVCAHGANRAERRRFLDGIAKDLSGPIYGHAISKDQAKQLIETQDVIRQ